jgi:hypothetical protein
MSKYTQNSSLMFMSVLLTHFDIVAATFLCSSWNFVFFQCGSKVDFNSSIVGCCVEVVCFKLLCDVGGFAWQVAGHMMATILKA